MLRNLSSNDDRFKTIAMRPGLNIIVSDMAEGASDTDSRNGVGKSSFVELLHFLLGLRTLSGSLLQNEALEKHSFTLHLDWKETSSLAVTRSMETPGRIYLTEEDRGDSPPSYETRDISRTEWVLALGKQLFNLPADPKGLNTRQLINLYVRRISQHGFNHPVQVVPNQGIAAATTNIAYLMGLDWRLAAQYQDLAARESLRRQLNQAMKDPAFKFIVGSVAELRGLVTSTLNRVERLRAQVAEFKVVPEYEDMQLRADMIDSTIRSLRAADAADRRNAEDLAAAISAEEEPDIDYLNRVYTDLGVQLPDALLTRYEDVKSFHDAVLANRRAYLEVELGDARTRLNERRRQREELGAEHARLLQVLTEGGALAALGVLREELSVAQADLQSLRTRLDTAKALEETQAEIRAARSSLQRDIGRDLSEREPLIQEINGLFQRFAYALYGSERDAYIDISALPTSLRIAPHISGEESEGIGKMVIFCFDFTVAVTAHKNGRGPDFLIHDSHLFDGVDERQVAEALSIARDACEEFDLQYIIAMNSDDLSKVQRFGISLDDNLLTPRLTDAYEDGGLFGFRFD